MPQYCTLSSFGVGSIDPNADAKGRPCSRSDWSKSCGRAGLKLCHRPIPSRVRGRNFLGRSTILRARTQHSWAASLFPYEYLVHQAGVPAPEELELVKYWPVRICGDSDTLLAASPQSSLLRAEKQQQEDVNSL